MPALDFAGVLVIILGDPAGGLAMIVGMLPAGIIALAVTWQWIHREEQAAHTGISRELGGRNWRP